jgi:hypothetical protein
LSEIFSNYTDAKIHPYKKNIMPIYDYMCLKRTITKLMRELMFKNIIESAKNLISDICWLDRWEEQNDVHRSVSDALEDPRNCTFSSSFHIPRFVSEPPNLGYYTGSVLGRLYLTPHFQ